MSDKTITDIKKIEEFFEAVKGKKIRLSCWVTVDDGNEYVVPFALLPPLTQDCEYRMNCRDRDNAIIDYHLFNGFEYDNGDFEGDVSVRWELVDPAEGQPDKTCTCGAAKCGGLHSDWCDAKE
jgi:hypothetical protein